MKTKYLILLLLFLLYLLKISSKNINMKFESKYPNQTAESITNMYGVADLIEMNNNGYLNKLTWFNIEGSWVVCIYVWLDRATIRFRVFGPSSFNTALQLVLRPHFLVHFV